VTPGARLQAAIELLAAIHSSASPADRVSAAFFRNRRYMGGQDRRDVIDRSYRVLRRRAALDWWIDRMGPLPAEVPPQDRERARVIAALVLAEGWSADRIAGSFDGGQYRPAPLSALERALARALQGQAPQGNTIEDPAMPRAVRLEFPAWLEPELEEHFGPALEAEMAALMAQAATDLRANTLKATREEARAALAAEGVAAEPTPLSPLGLRVAGRPPLASLACFKAGLIEVQDEGSQLVALLADARPGQRVADFCAGAGGKTLAMAAAMANKGKLVASDVLIGRVERAATRLNRAGVHNVERRGLASERDPWVKRHAGTFERVLLDAPCSGSGTWRRNPDAKWRLEPADIEELIALQRRILESAARLVKPRGRLIYATCSLLRRENEAQVEWFLAGHPGFHLLPVAEVWRGAIGGEPPKDARRGEGLGQALGEGPYLSLTPARHGTDAFFLAVLEREAKLPPDSPAPISSEE
jgi:16S rRNA (cytosine967-C5)-methyltransferase